MQPAKDQTSRDGAPATHGRLLLVEQDQLMTWSLTRYFQRWFTVDAAASGEAAEQLATAHAFTAVLTSDALPSERASAIHELVRQRNPVATAVRLVTAATETPAPEPPCLQLEKPFELARLARLLGVSEGEIAAT
ncbi:MAG: hypothetical protein PVJ57_18370 [Phycisphaerae bacterium]